jgi:NADH-quinone oxidoreductase subunit N
MLWMTRHKKNLWDERYQHPFTKFAGLVKVSPIMATTMAVFMFALAGLPPLSVFWGKLYLLSAAVNSGYIYLAVIMALNSAIAVYYYMKLVVFMFLKEQVSDDGEIYLSNATPLLIAILTIAVIITSASALAIDPLLEFFLTKVSMSGF